jgi:hypothetical protein
MNLMTLRAQLPRSGCKNVLEHVTKLALPHLFGKGGVCIVSGREGDEVMRHTPTESGFYKHSTITGIAGDN